MRNLGPLKRLPGNPFDVVLLRKTEPFYSRRTPGDMTIRVDGTPMDGQFKVRAGTASPKSDTFRAWPDTKPIQLGTETSEAIRRERAITATDRMAVKQVLRNRTPAPRWRGGGRWWFSASLRAVRRLRCSAIYLLKHASRRP
jgi:hypothetical protein